jgi:hypothetical protein
MVTKGRTITFGLDTPDDHGPAVEAVASLGVTRPGLDAPFATAG